MLSGGGEEFHASGLWRIGAAIRSRFQIVLPAVSTGLDQTEIQAIGPTRLLTYGSSVL